MNRAPGPNDRWWSQHQQTCGGSFIKVKEPEGYGQKKGKKKNDEKAAPKKNDGKDIRKFFGGDDKFNDQTQQDDQDILAALGDTKDGTEADQSMFACPICDQHLSHGEMFSHLDQCTKNI